MGSLVVPYNLGLLLTDYPCLFKIALGFILGDMSTKSGKFVSAYNGEKALNLRYVLLPDSTSTDIYATTV
jgi:hypothetical protein